ncbi:hypothetical protein B0H14DRAFT_2635717 [Mycena olivaceomarginata]|nr:hypothetical protein B0H14DRAFT_2635717 [Mycena olivaceomarginata]
MVRCPSISSDVSDVEDEDVIYFCPNCDSCPVCDSPPKATQAATTQSVAPNPTKLPAFERTTTCQRAQEYKDDTGIIYVKCLKERLTQIGRGLSKIAYNARLRLHTTEKFPLRSKHPSAALAFTTSPKLFSAYHRKVSLTLQGHPPLSPFKLSTLTSGSNESKKYLLRMPTPPTHSHGPEQRTRPALRNNSWKLRLRSRFLMQDEQSAGSELDQLADFVLGMTLNDEGSTPANQPSKLFTSHQSFQADRSSHIPTTFIREAVTMADAPLVYRHSSHPCRCAFAPSSTFDVAGNKRLKVWLLQ